MRRRSGSDWVPEDDFVSSEPTYGVPPREQGAGTSQVPGRVLLAGPYRLLLDLLTNLLEPEFNVVGSINDSEALIETAERLRPDLLLADVGLPGPNVVSVFRRLRQRRSAIRLICLTAEPNEATAVGAFCAGASACLSRYCTAADLRRAMGAVLEGGRHVPSGFHARDTEAGVKGTRLITRLSAREVQVLQLLIGGLPMKLVARQLGITPRTVAFHKYRAMNLLGLHGNKELMEFAIQNGLLVDTDQQRTDRRAITGSQD